MRYCIDYRNGGLGNAVLTHVLYSCGQIDVDFSNFFSTSGNAHNITTLNRTQLIAAHLIEFPNPNLTCIVELYPDDWNKLLRQKMGFSKWTNDEPRLDNIHKFFTLSSCADNNALWNDFYTKVKDPTWPICNTYDNVKYLPSNIQQEIHDIYQHPVTFELTNDSKLLEFLSIAYYDEWEIPIKSKYPNSLFYPLSDYFANNIDLLKQKIISVFPGWTWNQAKSNEIHTQILHINQCYFDWLSKIKTTVTDIINFKEQPVDLAVWEKAMAIARSCKYFEINPRTLHWDTTGCYLLENNVTLINYFKGRNNGQTI